MAIDTNVLLKAIVPDTTSAIKQGIDIGQTIRNAPLLREQRQNAIQQQEQQLATGDVEMGDKLSSAVYSLVGDVENLMPEQVRPLMNQLQASGFAIEEDDFSEDPENISNIMGLAKRGKSLSQTQRGGLASAKTTQYKDGTVVAFLPDGNRKVIAPNGQEVTDPDMQVSVINAANESGIIQAGQEAFTRASQSAQGTATGASEVIDITASNISAEEEARVRSQNQEKRDQDTIVAGLSAAPQYNDVVRGLELIDIVNQGGMASNAKAITDYFGTTSGDVGELNRTLATTVLQGLSAFTGAISEGERDFVESMSASLKQGKEVNRRQLERLKNIYQKEIRKAARIAKKNDDFSTLDSLKIDLGDSELGRELFPKAEQNKQESQQQPQAQSKYTIEIVE